MVVPSDRRGGTAGVPANLAAAGHAYDRGAHWIAVDVRSDLPWDNGCLDQGLAAGVVYGSEPSFADHLQGGKSKPRAGAQRRLVRRLCVVWCDIWAALRQLQSWVSNWSRKAACSVSRPEPICGMGNSSCHGRNISEPVASSPSERLMQRIRSETFSLWRLPSTISTRTLLRPEILWLRHNV